MERRFTLLIAMVLFISINLNAQVHDNPFAVKVNPNDKVTYKNPVIPGFYSDPSICRNGEDYYLVTSTFEYYPGVPVFHSKDLINWEQIGHCIHREDQLPEGVNIFACTIRYHKGVYYMITTNVGRGGNFYVTATNPAGPWSDPIWVNVPGIDPDLFFDEDGKVYVISSPFILYEINIETGKLLSEGRKLWHGAGGRYAEGPHIYKKDGYYYLMAAEGGTEEAHHETIARSNNIWGPYTENPANPILAHANAAGQNSLIQGVGHADIIQAHDDSWWIVFHGYRKAIGYPVHHLLGRETCVAPVSWPKNGWPVVNGNGTATVNMACPTLPLKPFDKKPERTEFEEANLGLEWNTIQPVKEGERFYNLKEGKLYLTGLAGTIGGKERPAFVGRRLQHMTFHAGTNIDFNPKYTNEKAGLILLNNGEHFDLLVRKGNRGKRVVVAELHFGNITYMSEEFVLQKGPVDLKISGEGNWFTFSYSQNGKETEVEKVDARYLSTQTVGGFTGVYAGLYATGEGQVCDEVAVFDYFEYSGK